MIKVMMGQGNGRTIVNTSEGLEGFMNIDAYSSSKWAVNGM